MLLIMTPIVVSIHTEGSVVLMNYCEGEGLCIRVRVTPVLLCRATRGYTMSREWCLSGKTVKGLINAFPRAMGLMMSVQVGVLQLSPTQQQQRGLLLSQHTRLRWLGNV